MSRPREESQGTSTGQPSAGSHADGTALQARAWSRPSSPQVCAPLCTDTKLLTAGSRAKDVWEPHLEGRYLPNTQNARQEVLGWQSTSAKPKGEDIS